MVHEQTTSVRNGQLVRELLQATAEVGFRTPAAARLFLDALDPEVVFDPSQVWPDTSVYHGHDGVRRFFASWFAPWDEYHNDVREVIELGDSVVVMLHEHGTTRDTGIAVDHVVAQLWRLKDGRVTHWCACATKEDALRAAALGD